MVAATARHVDPADNYIVKYMNATRNEQNEQVPVTVAVTKYPRSRPGFKPSSTSPSSASSDDGGGGGGGGGDASHNTSGGGGGGSSATSSRPSASTLFFKQPSDKHLLAAAKRFKAKSADIFRVYIEDASRVSDAGIAALASVFTELECVEVTLSNKVTDEGIGTLAKQCRNLKVLNLAYCNNIGNSALKLLGR